MSGKYLVILTLSATLLLPGALRAQETKPAGPDTITEIAIKGNVQMTDRAVLARVKIRAGQRYNENLVKADVQRLLQTRRFDSVVTTKTQTDKGILVTFVVSERPLLKSVSVVGNKSFGTGELLKDITFGRNDPIDPERFERGRQNLLNKYHDKGFPDVSVTYDHAAAQKGDLKYLIVEGPQVRITKVVFDGNKFYGYLKLWSTMSSKPRLWPFVQGFLDTDQISRDADTLRNLYVGDGFLDAEVGREVVFSANRKKATLIFHIKQGPRFRVNEIKFVGNTVFRDRDLTAKLNLQRSGWFTSLKLQRDIRTLQDTYGALGFIDATVKADRQFLPPNAPPPAWAAGLDKGHPALINVVFTLSENGQYYVGRVDIRGNTVTKARVIRREVRVYPQQLFNTVAIEESKRRLNESGYFEPNSVSIKPVNGQGNVRDVLVQVQEGRTAEFIIGVGVSSRDGLLGNIAFKQRNFDINKPGGWDAIKKGSAWKGAGQMLSAQVEPGTELNRASVSWFTPYIGDQPYSFGSKLFLFQRERESYTETRYGLVNSIGHRFANDWYGEFGNRIEGVNIDDIDDDAPIEVVEDKGSHLLIGFKPSIIRDRTDSRYLPSKGDRLRFSYEQVVGSYNFGLAEAEYSIFHTVHVDALERKHIVSGHFEIGQVIGDAPVFEKYYGGGLGSIRGFKYRGVSPRSGPDEDPIGGKFLFLAGTEYTFPLIGDQLRGVLFVDTGTVTESGATPYRVAAGPGIRWIIPFFGQVPLNLNLGFPLMKSDQDDTEIFSFSFGMTF